MKNILLVIFLIFSFNAFAQVEETPFNKFTRKAKEVGAKSVEELKKAKNKIIGEDKKQVVEETPKVETTETPVVVAPAKVDSPATTPIPTSTPLLVEPEPTLLEKTKTKTGEVVDRASYELEKVNQKMNESQYHRAESFGTAMLHYQPISTWLPSKKALSYTQIFSKEWSGEFEYAWASISFPVFGIDIGEISEKRYTLQARRYVGNSFHFLFGGYKNDFNVRIGNDILDRMSVKSIDMFSVENMGLTVGIGNRWQLKNGFTWGVDWFRMNYPMFGKKTDDKILTNMTDEGDRSDLKKITRRFESFPTFVLLGLNIGYTF